MSAPVIMSGGEDTIDSAEIFARLLAKRWWVVCSVLVFTAAFTAAAFIMTPIYRATTILVPANTGQNSASLGAALGQLGGIASLAGINVGGRSSVTDEALAVLHSRGFTERFIADEKLMPKLFASRWDAAAGTWKAGKAPTPAKAYRYFNEKIRAVDQDKKTGLVTMQIDWKDRNEAAAWANELVERLNQEMRDRAITEADASLGFLNNELQTTTAVAARDAIGRLIESQIKQRMLADVSKEFVFRIVDKAMPPDADSPVKPQKLAMFAAGPVLGLLIGILLVLVASDSRRSARKALPQL
jgi:uncharacterized protein involved in exopolysaccharide biosynthesis